MKKILNLGKKITGITLVSLVITIIILLILAGVTIVTLTNENGILQKANNSKDISNQATEKEKIQMLIQELKIGSQLDTQDFKFYATEGNGRTIIDNSGITCTVETENLKFSIGDTMIRTDFQGQIIPIRAADILEIGDFVNYDAGQWTQTEINNLGSLYSGAIVNDTDYTFSGFEENTNRNLSSMAYSNGEYQNTYEQGWRVLSKNIETGEIKIVHAGTVESYYFPYETNGGYINQYILGGGIHEGYEPNGLTVRDWNMYKDTLLSDANVNARLLNYDETVAITGSALDDTDNTLRNIYARYWVPLAFDSYHLWFVSGHGGMADNYCDGFGIRPVITLKRNIKISENNTGDGTTYENRYQLEIIE